MTIANELIKVITASQRSEARSNQKEVGPSEIGGCARKLWSRLNDVEKTNDKTLRLASIMGTAIHSYIQQAFYAQDPFGEKYILEQEWVSEEYGLKGHVDLYDKINYEVVDWKSSTKKNLGGYFPSQQQRWQVHLYGLLLEANGHKVETVTLVGIPRDGNESDIVYHSEPWDLSIAQEALRWRDNVANAGEAPEPQKDVSFCKNYCSYYDATGEKGCAGRPKELAQEATIDDPQLSQAALMYLQINEQIKELEAQQDTIKAALEGTNGVTPEGIKVTWSTVAGRSTIDESEVQKLLGFVPKKTGKESYRLTVKQ